MTVSEHNAEIRVRLIGAALTGLLANGERYTHHVTNQGNTFESYLHGVVTDAEAAADIAMVGIRQHQ